MRDRLIARDVPRVALSPIVGGEAIKGPAAKMMAEMGYPVTAKAVAEYYMVSSMAMSLMTLDAEVDH